MGQQQSKDELLYQQVNYNNIEGIKALCRDGAGLEWIDREGKTPLVVACMNPELHSVAKTLIELGANVNAYRPGRHAGTPLHHAAKRGLEHTVKLLLSCGANALVMNDDCQTPLDVARAKGYSNVVRAIESHICLFSGWLREFYGPGFLEVLAPQLVCRKVWVVVLPCGSRNPTKPFKLELAIYSTFQDPQPRTLIALWKANMEEPKFHQHDPAVMIVYNSTKGGQGRIKLAPANENDKQQLEWFCNACKGILQAMEPAFLHAMQTPVLPATAPPTAEDTEFALAINASVQSAMERPPPFKAHSSHEAIASSSGSTSHGSVGETIAPGPSNGSSTWGVHLTGPSVNSAQHTQIQNNTPATQANYETSDPAALPSAPSIANEVIDNEPIHYPSIDFGPVDMSSPTVEIMPTSASERKEDGDSSSCCVVCLDAPVEGACIPCGHMVGCMSCLNEIKAKKWGCPVCRAKIEQVIRLYAV